jgi:hypothetical protein
VLSNTDARRKYNAQLEVALADDEDDYTGEPLSKWVPGSHPEMAKHSDPAEDRAVFVVSGVLTLIASTVWWLWRVVW